MKNTKRNTIVVLLIMIVVMFFILKDDYENILNNLLLANKWYILFGIVLIFLYWLLRALCLHIIVREYKPKMKLSRMVQQVLITQFFNGITPFSTGGQPMQVYMLKKSGVKIASATNIIVQDFIMYQLALIVIGVFALIINWKFHLFEVSSMLSALIIVGFIINVLVGAFLLFVSFSRKFNNFIGTMIIKLGAKFKIVKDSEKVVAKWEEKLTEYHESAHLFKKKKWLFIKCFIYNLISLILFYIIPYFVFMSFDTSLDISILEVMVSSAFILIIGNFVPIPGGSGGIEYGFLKFFGIFITSSILSSGLIIWRFITYYLGIIIGGVALGFFKGDGKKA
ncbi:MAG: flippase-like domain-containing protein [Bacilli bacterium]|nr:flippase-like domain-containing protein [Bacilli bacterium]